jgi:hypothetical protein
MMTNKWSGKNNAMVINKKDTEQIIEAGMK